MADPTRLAWRLAGITFYVLSGLIVTLFLTRRVLPEGSLLQRLGQGFHERLQGWRLRHTVLLSLVAIGGLLLLHAFTIRNLDAINYYDLRGWWIPAGEAMLEGGNPYAPRGPVHTFDNAINYGLLFPALLALGLALAGPYGIVLVLGAFALAVPVLTHLLADDVLEDPGHRATAVLLVTLIPQSLFYMVRSVQDEPITVFAILATLLLLRRGHLLVAAVAAGLLSSVKYLPLALFAAFLVLRYREDHPDDWTAVLRDPRVLLRYGGTSLAAVGTFGLTVLAGHLAYGPHFLERTFGMAELLPTLRVFTVLDHWWTSVPPGLMADLFLGALLLLYAALLVRPAAPAPGSTAPYLRVLLFALALLFLLFPMMNADFVSFVMAAGLLLFLNRWETHDGAVTVPLLLASPAYLLTLSVLADLRNYANMYLPKTYQGEERLFVELGFTTMFLLLVALTWPRWRHTDPGPGDAALAA